MRTRGIIEGRQMCNREIEKEEAFMSAAMWRGLEPTPTFGPAPTVR